MSLKQQVNSLRRHPSVIVDIMMGKKWPQIEAKTRRLDLKEVNKFIMHMKNNLVTKPEVPNVRLRFNRLCCLEDWNNQEITYALSELGKLNPYGLIHRKDWEWATGILAIQKLGKLNKNSIALGVGTGTEPIPFYLANKIRHVYATDLYGQVKGWERAAPLGFYKNPEAYSAFPYDKNALTVSIMDGRNLEFPSETFDIVFSFSSVEHFGGKNHSGALISLKEMERVLKPEGLAVITTEYILNKKKHAEFFNEHTIYSDLINKLNCLDLVEPLYLGTTSNTLNTVIDFSLDRNWDSVELNYKKTHPVILIRLRNILFTSILLVFKKV